MSKDEEDNTTPLSPPKVNKNKNPYPQNFKMLVPPIPIKDTLHLKILIPVGIAIIIVAAVKYPRVSTSILTVNMWCAHTTHPKPPIESIAKTIPLCPNKYLFVVINKKWDITPKAGKIKI